MASPSPTPTPHSATASVSGGSVSSPQERPAHTRPVTAANYRILGLRARALVRALDSRVGPCLSPRRSGDWDGAVEDMLMRRQRALHFTITRYAESYRRRAMPRDEATRTFRAEIERALGVAASTANGMLVITTALGWLIDQGL